MNLLAPIKTIMTTQLVTVSDNDPMHVVDEIFKTTRFHHIPVVSQGNLIGMVSKSDYNLFLRGFQDGERTNKYRLRTYMVKDIMTDKLAKLEEDDNINIALEVFNENMFHAIPITKDGKLVGIVTTFDIIKSLATDGFAVSEYN